MKHTKRILSLLLTVVMILSVAAGCIVTTGATETETTDIRDTWWADEEWRAEFNEWVENYYTVTGTTSVATTEFEIGSVAELYAFWRISLDRESKVNYTGGTNSANMDFNTWTSDNFTSLTDYKAGKANSDGYTNSGYATRFTFVLMADIDLQGATWPGIFNFGGDFFGNGYSISNFVMNTEIVSGATKYNAVNGFFMNCTSYYRNTHLLIKDLILKDATITTITNLTSGSHTGGLIGRVFYNSTDQTEESGTLTVQNVMLDNVNVTIHSDATTSGWYYAGGVVGMIAVNTMSVTLDGVYYKGTITEQITASSNYSARLGGLVSSNCATETSGSPYATLTIQNCMSLPTFGVDDAITQMRAYTCQTSSVNLKNVNPTSVHHLDMSKLAATDKTFTSSTLAYRDLTTKPFTGDDIPTGTGAAWYADETYGIIPAGLADNVLYPNYVQLSNSPDAEKGYSIRILGALQSLDLNAINVKIEVKRHEADDAAWQPVPNVAPVKQVYTSVYAAGETVTAESLGCEYLWGVELYGIDPEKNAFDLDIRVTVTKTFADEALGEQTMNAKTTTVSIPAATN